MSAVSTAATANRLPAQFFVGEYRVVGVDPLTQMPYQGHCRIVLDDDGELVMHRTIGGRKTTAAMTFETVTADDISILQARFKKGGEPHVISYLINGDINNYARLSGHAGVEGGTRSLASGLETLFHLGGETRDLAEAELKNLKLDNAELDSQEIVRLETFLKAINDKPETAVNEEPKPMALSDPEFLRLMTKYEESDTELKHQAVIPRLLTVQRGHRALFDQLTTGSAILDYPGLIALGPVKHIEKSEMGDAHYQLTIGVRPRTAGDNLRGLTALDIRFDESGIVTGKSVPRYRW